MSSSEKHLNQHFQRIPDAEEMSQFLAINQEQFEQLLTFIDFAENFTLGFIEINFPPDIELLINSLQKHPECQDIQFCIFNLPDKNLRFLRDEIVKHLESYQIQENKKLVLIIWGLEKSIGVFGDYPPVLQDLNFVRDAYKTKVPHPILFILPDYAITRLAKFSPDFWAWNSGTFRFKTPDRTRENALQQTRNFESVIDRLEPPEKQERIDLLERLLMEYKPTGSNIAEGHIRRYVNILQQLGNAYLKQRKPEKAREYLEVALKTIENIEDITLQGELFSLIGITYYQQRKFEESMTFHKKSLEIAYDTDDRIKEARALFYLGNNYLELKEFEEAKTYYKQVLDIHIERDDLYGCAGVYHNLGMVAHQLRKLEEAKNYYQQALNIKIQFGDCYGCAYTYHQLGIIAQNLRKLEEAKNYYQQALDIYIELNDRYNCTSTYHQLGMVAQDLWKFEEAKTYYQQALDIKIELNNRYECASTYGQLGLLAKELEDFTEAENNLIQALEIFTEFNDEYNVIITFNNLARIYETTGNQSILKRVAQIFGTTSEEVRGRFAEEEREEEKSDTL